MDYDIFLKEQELAFMIVNEEGDFIHIDLPNREAFKIFAEFIRREQF